MGLDFCALGYRILGDITSELISCLGDLHSVPDSRLPGLRSVSLKTKHFCAWAPLHICPSPWGVKVHSALTPGGSWYPSTGLISTVGDFRECTLFMLILDLRILFSSLFASSFVLKRHMYHIYYMYITCIIHASLKHRNTFWEMHPSAVVCEPHKMHSHEPRWSK